ncbi:hypothetical protein ID853_13525 [Xenorhabdus sp. Vera]|uniref:hypothetical protein n=1 Tax=Xenorhabdus koppenhoeferi TaxID=351659 RepID=UPI0019CD09C4|nr:hypothetical protein [Xenorhabdus sp. Vera]MBD2811880.1 hypothetical protein [Xenorhabdus sp. Vera]
MSNPIIMYDSPEAAQIKTVTGWISRDGRFWGDDEHMARYAGSTHHTCENNPEHPICYKHGYCELCRAKMRLAEFNAMERKEWDRKTPLVIFDTDQFFMHEDDLDDYLDNYCDEHEITPSELQLVICEPNYPDEINGEDYFSDDLADGGELPGALQQAFDALNAEIRNSPPLSWSQGKYAAIVSDSEAVYVHPREPQPQSNTTS